MTTVIVPCHCDGGADRLASALGLQESGSEWIGDCPACKGSETLSVRQSRDGHPAHVLCVCRGACPDAAAFRAALYEILGPGSLTHPNRDRPIVTDLLNLDRERLASASKPEPATLGSTAGTLPFGTGASPIGDTEP